MQSKPTLLIPMAGRGQRFVDKGYTNPKPLIIAGGQHIIDYSFDSIDPTEYNLVFIVREDHIRDFAMDEVLRAKFGKDIVVVSTNSVTQGSVCSCLLAQKYIDMEAPLVIYTLDVGFSPVFKFEQVPKDADGFILTFKANSPSYSYALLRPDGSVERTAEKSVISPNAAVGIYAFKSGRQFVEAANQMIEAERKTNGEYYICPLYNELIRDGAKIVTKDVEKMHLMGTPDELDFFVKKTLPAFGDKPIVLCADHSGFELKQKCVELLKEEGLEYIDFGTYSPRDCDYNDYVRQATKHIRDGIADFGLGFCRSGQGVNIAANKNPGIRAALIFDEYTAEYSRRHNCANFFSIPSKYVDDKMLKKMILKFFVTFDGGRHYSRVKKMEDYEIH